MSTIEFYIEQQFVAVIEYVTELVFRKPGTESNRKYSIENKKLENMECLKKYLHF